MKKYFNKEQLELLKEAEEYFYTVIKAQYKRGTPITLNDKIADIYDSLGEDKINRNWNCNTCIYNAFKKIGELYYESLNIVQVEKEPVLKMKELKTNVTNNETKKRGRPKHISK